MPATVTKFKCEAMVGNGNQVNLLKLASQFQKIRVIISIKWIYFWRVSAVSNQVRHVQRHKQGVQTDLKYLCNVSGWCLRLNFFKWELRLWTNVKNTASFIHCTANLAHIQNLLREIILFLADFSRLKPGAHRRERGVRTDLKSLCNVSGWCLRLVWRRQPHFL